MLTKKQQVYETPLHHINLNYDRSLLGVVVCKIYNKINQIDMNGQKIKLTDEMSQFLNSWNRVKLDRDNDWIYIPFWFKITDDPNIVEVYSFEKLPENVGQYEREQRQIIIDRPDKVRNRVYPLLESEAFKVAPVEDKQPRRRKIVKKYEPVKKEL